MGSVNGLYENKLSVAAVAITPPKAA